MTTRIHTSGVTVTLEQPAIEVTSMDDSTRRFMPDDTRIKLEDDEGNEFVLSSSEIEREAGIDSRSFFEDLMKRKIDERDYEAAPHLVQVAWRLLGRRPRAMPDVGWEG